ncbi:MAG TPA: HNH endonuclease, partial [Polyangiaceae bacterium]|nr:HNH endonuclease [Polyangiaceae bacterium]
HRAGSRPGDVPDPSARRHVLRFEISGEALASFREAMAKIRREAGEALVVDMAECDGQHIGHVETVAPGVHVDAHVGTAEKPTRATQSIPPALRRQVLRRDGGRCQVPGCRHATFVDVHHLRPRSERGANTIENVVTLCGAHHRASHAGKLSSEGTPSAGLRFLHPDGTPYGHAPSPALAELRARAYRALMHLGFRESEAKWALARASLTANVTLEDLIRQTLRELAPDRH